jgi:hypothetical protein
VTDEKQDNLRERLERQWRKRRPDGKSELSAEGKEVETPERGDFFGNLEKVASEESSEKPPHPQERNGG